MMKFNFRIILYLITSNKLFLFFYPAHPCEESVHLIVMLLGFVLQGRGNKVTKISKQYLNYFVCLVIAIWTK